MSILLRFFKSIVFCTGIFIAISFHHTNTQNPAEALKVQNWYMGRIKDDLPLMENIRDCSCPRVYMPVCGTDNKTYTNVCWMNCVNRHKRLTKKGRLASLFHRGFCQTFIDPFQY